ncbi:cysteine proteinase [Thelephora terrestris]|uniref:ubiquitinyl hydrolase 1 n=1 Tax=Thelephora terrestris TaxID=56493 RepID=A0A9P6HES7_9AGAM|nr:cysteine proteinase [Thelephora terrestris]
MQLPSGSQTPGQATSSEPENASRPSVVVNENTDISLLTQAQLYDLNQNLLEDAVPNIPLIGPLSSISTLRAEYEEGSRSFVNQVDYLASQGYLSVRRARGDGDCFYRSLAFAFIEYLLNSPQTNVAVALATSLLESTIPMLEDAGFQKLVFEDFYEVLLSLIQQIVVPEPGGTTLTSETLLEAFQSPEVSNSVVVYLRLVASAQIRNDPEEYSPFLFHPELGEPMGTREFCEHFVEAVGKEADHVQMTALTRALKLNLNVAYLDGRSSTGKVDFVEFRDPDSQLENGSPITLLYRPGHYDILDKRTAEAL